MKELVEFKTTKCFDISCKEMEIVELSRIFYFIFFQFCDIVGKKRKISEIYDRETNILIFHSFSFFLNDNFVFPKNEQNKTH
jgi:catabolite regulation protein CreA